MVNYFAKQNVNVRNLDNVKVEAVANIRYNKEGRDKRWRRGKK